MVWEYCTSASAIDSAGKSVGTVSGSGTTLERWYIQAHGVVNAAARKDFSGSALADIPQGIIEETTAKMIANNLIAWDMGQYTTQIEAEDMIIVNRDVILRNLSILRDIKTQTYIDGAT